MTRLAAMTDTPPDPAQVRLGEEADPRLRRTGLSDQIGFTLRVAQIAVWSDLVRTLTPFDLRPQQYAALLIVRANDGCKQQDVAAALGIQRPNLVGLLDELVGRGLVARDINAADRRSYQLSITDAGLKLLARVDPAHEAHLRRIAECVAPAEEAALLASLRRLARIGEQA